MSRKPVKGSLTGFDLCYLCRGWSAYNDLHTMLLQFDVRYHSKSVLSSFDGCLQKTTEQLYFLDIDLFIWHFTTGVLYQSMSNNVVQRRIYQQLKNPQRRKKLFNAFSLSNRNWPKTTSIFDIDRHWLHDIEWKIDVDFSEKSATLTVSSFLLNSCSNF